jgi:ribose-phosphate pyrophosphokinase
MQTPSLLLYFEDEMALATQIADAAGMSRSQVAQHVFPDGEIKLRLPPSLPPRVVVLRSLSNPNAKLVELLLTARTARLLGAQHLTLVAPYLAYMRQDIAFQPGEAISQKIVGQHLADLFDAVITVDPHLHRVATLQEAVPAQQALVLSAASLLSDFAFQQCPDILLMGPDEESEQWITEASKPHGLDHAVCKKIRHDDRHVEIALPDVNVAGRAVVLLDDIASSGHTLAQTAKRLRQAGAKSVDVAIIHALFSEDAVQLIQASGVDRIWSTDSVVHRSNCVSIAGLIADALTTI